MTTRKQKKITDFLNQKKAPLWIERKSKIPNRTQTNSKEFDSKQEKVTNPFCKEIDRHYGSFKTRILGNHKTIFNSLPFKEIKPLGIKGKGCKRKLFSNPSFTALFYQNGTVEIKPSRDKSKALSAPGSLQQAFFEKAGEAARLLEKKGGFALGNLSMNRLPMYAVVDRLARENGGECEGEFRRIDSSPNHPHVDNKGKLAAERDCRLSDDQHHSLSHELLRKNGAKTGDEGFDLKFYRVNNAEILESFEKKLNGLLEANAMALEAARATAEASSVLGENMKTHVEIMKRNAKGLEAIALATDGTTAAMNEFSRLLRAFRPRAARMPSSFKRSATVRGVC